MLSQFSGVKIFGLCICVINICNLAGGSEIFVAELTLGLFVSDNTEIYFNVSEPRLKFLNTFYQSDYPIAHTVSINFSNCLSQIG